MECISGSPPAQAEPTAGSRSRGRSAVASNALADESADDPSGSIAHVGKLRRVAPAVGLFLLAPLVGEYLLGNVPISQLPALVFLAPMYGGGALLLREAARRAGRGWPTIMLLALAYGVLEPGLLDHSLFNPSFQGHDFRGVTHVPALGIGVSVANALAFTVGHAVWSIGAPIAVVETFVPGRRTTPWLGKIGTVIAGVLFLFGAFAIFRWAVRTEDFLPSVPQMLATAAVVSALIAAAFAVGRAPATPVLRRAPRPWLVGVVSFVASSLFAAKSEDWPGVAFGLLLIAAVAGLVIRWSRRDGWGAVHRLALAGGALLTYAWLGFVLSALILGRTGAVDLIGNAVFAAGAVALLAAAARTVRKVGDAT